LSSHQRATPRGPDSKRQTTNGEAAEDSDDSQVVSNTGLNKRHVMTYWMHQRYSVDALSPDFRLELQKLDTLIFSISNENRALDLLTELQDQDQAEPYHTSTESSSFDERDISETNPREGLPTHDSEGVRRA
jgi:hypothetical protein